MSPKTKTTSNIIFNISIVNSEHYA